MCPPGGSPGGGFPFSKLTGFLGSLEGLLCPAGGKDPGKVMVGQGFEVAESLTYFTCWLSAYMCLALWVCRLEGKCQRVLVEE